jgi:hypothetical protein
MSSNPFDSTACGLDVSFIGSASVALYKKKLIPSEFYTRKLEKDVG